MSTKALALLEAFEALAEKEKLDFAYAVLRRLPALESGPLDDKVVAKAGDELAAMLDAEENGSSTR
jgi:hypothetical protein